MVMVTRGWTDDGQGIGGNGDPPPPRVRVGRGRGPSPLVRHDGFTLLVVFILFKIVNSCCFCVTLFCCGGCKLVGMWYLP